MTLKEGRCPNCGSILHLDEKAEQGHCLFCDAVFANSRAFEIAINPAGVEFPNEPQPKYEGPNIDPVVKTPAGVKVPPPRRQPPRKAAEPQPQYVHKEKIKLPEVKLTPRTRLGVILVFVIIAALIIGIGVPTVTRRDNDRSAIVSEFQKQLPMSVDADNAIAIRHVANDLLLLALPEDISTDQAIEIFKNYCLTRADVRQESNAGFDRIYGKVEVRIFTPGGGYRISDLKSEAELSAAAVVVTG
jgi:hypothetical protein